MRPYPLSGRKCGAVATTGVIFCSSRVTIGTVESGLRIRGRRNWVLLASPASNGGCRRGSQVGSQGRRANGVGVALGPYCCLAQAWEPK